MGYTTTFTGTFVLDKPLTLPQYQYLRQFADTRRMSRLESHPKLQKDPVRVAVGLPVGDSGQYYVGGGQEVKWRGDSIVDHNNPPASQPGLWCQWVPTIEMNGIEWDGNEKFYHSGEWLQYLVDHFLDPWDLTLDGVVRYQGEDREDTGAILCQSNQVTLQPDHEDMVVFPRTLVSHKVVVKSPKGIVPQVNHMMLNPVFTPPTSCPECRSTLLMEGQYLVCRNQDCPAQTAGMINRWVSKIGVLHCGESFVGALIDEGLVQDIADLYWVNIPDAAKVMIGDRVAGGTAALALNNLHGKKDLELYQIVGSLGIPLIGRSMAKAVQDAGLDTWEKMRAASYQSLVPILGPARAAEFQSGLCAKEPLVQRIFQAGVTVKKAAQGNLTGKSFCMTGFRDPSMEDAIARMGGNIKGSVGKGLTYLITKDPTSTSGKSQKARDLGIQCITPQEAWKIINP